MSNLLELFKEEERHLVNPKFENLLEEEKNNKAENKDHYVNISPENIILDGNKLVVRDSKLELDFTNHGFSQFCTSLKMPAPFIQTLPTDIDKNIFDYRLNEYKGKQLFFRTKNDNLLRSVHSDKYSAYDNFDVLSNIKIALNTLDKDFEIKFKTFTKYDGGFHLKMLFPDIEKEEMNVGVVVKNSEIGMSAIRVMPFVHRLPCTNDAISMESAFKQSHIHFDFREMNERILKAMGESILLGNDNIDKMIELQNIKINNPYNLIENISNLKNFNLPQKHIKIVKDTYDLEPNIQGDMFGIMNAFTRTAQVLNFNDRFELEQKATSILKFTPKTIIKLDEVA